MVKVVIYVVSYCVYTDIDNIGEAVPSSDCYAFAKKEDAQKKFNEKLTEILEANMSFDEEEIEDFFKRNGNEMNWFSHAEESVYLAYSLELKEVELN